MKTLVSPFRLALLASVFSMGATVAMAATDPTEGTIYTPLEGYASTEAPAAATPVATTPPTETASTDADKDACKDSSASGGASKAPNAAGAAAAAKLKDKCKKPQYDMASGFDALSAPNPAEAQKGFTPTQEFNIPGKLEAASTFTPTNENLMDNVTTASVKVDNTNFGGLSGQAQTAMTAPQSVKYSMEMTNTFNPAYSNVVAPKMNDSLAVGMDYVNSSDPKAPLRMAFMSTMVNKYGMSPVEAAAYAGNIDHESNAFAPQKLKYDPNTNTYSRVLDNKGELAYGDYQNGKATSFGVGQFHNSRAQSMLNFVGADNASKSELKGTLYDQWDFMAQKDIGSQSKQLQTINGSMSVQQATGIVTNKYEIPALQNGQMYGRMGGTDRYNNAVTAMNQYNSLVGGGSGDGYAPVAGGDGAGGTGASLNTQGGGTRTGGGFHTGNSTIDTVLNGATGGGFHTGNSTIDTVLNGVAGGSQVTNLGGMLNTGNTNLSTSMLTQYLLAQVMANNSTSTGSGSGNSGGSHGTTTYTSNTYSKGVKTVEKVTISADGKTKTTHITKTDGSGKVIEDTTTTEDLDGAAS